MRFATWVWEGVAEERVEIYTSKQSMLIAEERVDINTNKQSMLMNHNGYIKRVEEGLAREGLFVW